MFSLRLNELLKNHFVLKFTAARADSGGFCAQKYILLVQYNRTIKFKLPFALSRTTEKCFGKEATIAYHSYKYLLTVSKPVSIEAAINLSKVISKLSPLFPVNEF